MEEVSGPDGSPLVETEGVASAHCDSWTETLEEMRDSVVLWKAIWKRRHRNAGTRVEAEAEEIVTETNGHDPDAIVDDWNDEAEAAEDDAEGEGE